MTNIVNIRNSDVNPSKGSTCPAPVYPPFSVPLEVARRIRADIFTEGELPTLGYWHKNWWLFNGKIWQKKDADYVRLPLWERLEKVKTENKGELTNWCPTKTRVENVLDPLRLISLFDDDRKPPMWVDDEKHATPPGSLIVLSNGWFNLETKEFKPGHSPALFTTSNLPFDYDPDARCPRWEEFLNEVFAHDPDGALALQEFAGYVISGRTDMQKALMLLGPPRSGKGIISKRLKQLVGISNTISPKLTAVGAEYGTWELVNKSLAVVEDNRDNKQGDLIDAVERLLNIIGEDAVSANRKHIGYWNGTLKTRFMIVSNEDPYLPDSSGAILSRFIFVKLKKSFEGHEDTSLNDVLNGEIAGIFNWALAGLWRLEKQGRFTRPQVTDSVRSMMSALSQPEKTFLDESDRYEVSDDPSDWVLVKHVYAAYKNWCADSGHRSCNQANFINKLCSAELRVSEKNTSVNGDRKARRFFGIKDTVPTPF